jgi:L-threonylcarbamoyladenylate synthase
MNNDITKALEVLRNGGLILYPTDTIWGIGCDATNSEAVKKVYALKQRSDSKSMLVLVDYISRIERYVGEVPEVAWDLVELATSPLTVIYSGAKNLAPELVAEDGSVGIRVANDEFCQKLITRFGKPIVSTSANISGQPSPAFFNEIADEVKQGVDYVVVHRQDDNVARKPSGIIKLGKGGEIKIIRQ